MTTHTKIGILYPGAMGISIAAAAQNSGHTVYWASERSTKNLILRPFSPKDADAMHAIMSGADVR